MRISSAFHACSQKAQKAEMQSGDPEWIVADCHFLFCLPGLPVFFCVANQQKLVF
jgi:hypothetical protein